MSIGIIEMKNPMMNASMSSFMSSSSLCGYYSTPFRILVNHFSSRELLSRHSGLINDFPGALDVDPPSVSCYTTGIGGTMARTEDAIAYVIRQKGKWRQFCERTGLGYEWLKKVADGRLKHPRSQWIDVILDDMEKTEGKRYS